MNDLQISVTTDKRVDHTFFTRQYRMRGYLHFPRHRLVRGGCAVDAERQPEVFHNLPESPPIVSAVIQRASPEEIVIP